MFAAIAAVPLIALFTFIITVMYRRSVSGLEALCVRELDMNEKIVSEQMRTCALVERSVYADSDLLFFLSASDFQDEGELVDFIRAENLMFERLISVVPCLYSVRIFYSSPAFFERFPVFLSESRTDLASLREWEFNYTADFFKVQTPFSLPSVCMTKEIRRGRMHAGWMQVAVRTEDFFPFLKNVPSPWEADFVFVQDAPSGTIRQLVLPGQEQALLKNDALTDLAAAFAAGDGQGEADVCRVRIGKKKFITAWRRIADPGIIIAHTCSYHMVFRSLVFMALLSLAGLMFVFACFYFIVRFASFRMFRGIYSVMSGMRKVRSGNLGVQIEVSGVSEVAEAQQTFNSMTRQLASQIEQIKAEQQLIADTEMKAMQNQINAHFLYNVLETIHMQALLAGNDDVSRSILILSRMMRYCLRWRIHTVTLREEMDYIRSYVDILNIRNDYEIELVFDVPDAMLSLPIPKMIVQPVVENSFVHGIEPLAQGGRIRIFTQEDADGKKIWLCVKDYGAGMSGAKRDEVLSYLADEKYERDSQGSIGIKNIQQRLFMFYGAGYKIQIESKEGEGTLVRIPLPVKGDVRP